MNLFKRPIVFLDFEATGIDPFVDRAVSLAMIRYEPGAAEATEWYEMINPDRAIPPETTAIHGISDADVKDKPTFKERAREILPWFEDADLAGYNIGRYDMPLLVTEMERAGISFPWRDRNIIDPCNIFKKKEPRDLTAAVKFFTGEKIEGAHNALIDIAATVRVFFGQMERYADLKGMSVEQLSEFSEAKPSIDLAGKLGFNQAGEPIYMFGKSRGKRVVDDPGFGAWMIRSDFPTDTIDCVRKILNDGARDGVIPCAD